MPWWEGQLERYVRGRKPAELRLLLERLLVELDPDQYLAVAHAVREEGTRRGLLPRRVEAGRETGR